MRNAQRAFATAVNTHLQPFRSFIITQLAESYSAARSATADAVVLRRMFDQAGCDSDHLPVLVTNFVPHPLGDNDGWEQQLAAWRRQGYSV